MRWFKCTLAYDGAAYCGWQRQANGPSIQAALETALAKITGQSIAVVGSGRTDAGVHAAGQVASFAAETQLDCSVLNRAINAHLPHDIRVLAIDGAGEGFNARADAISKWYRYSIHNAEVADVFSRGVRWFVPGPLDDQAMQRAARALVGRRDFASFQSSGSPRASTVRTVARLDVTRRESSEDAPFFQEGSAQGRAGEGALVTIDVEADGFLYNMVRAIVGALVEVGRAGRTEAWIEQILVAQDRRAGGPTAPPHGLCLMRVWYGNE